MTNTDIYLAVESILTISTGCPTIVKSNPNAESPKGDYAAVHTAGSKKRWGRSIVTIKDGVQNGDYIDPKTTVATQYIADVTINFYRGEANEYACRVAECYRLPSVAAILHKARLGWIDCGPVNDLTALNESDSYEPRAQVTLRLAFEQLAEEYSNSIDSAHIEVTNKENDSTTVIDVPKEGNL